MYLWNELSAIQTQEEVNILHIIVLAMQVISTQLHETSLIEYWRIIINYNVQHCAKEIVII
jgi:hypothetical protein